MVYYYTGTGNSRYVAERISAAIHDDCEDLFKRLQANDVSEIRSDRSLVFVSPTYAWQLPHIVRDWLEKVPITGCKETYFVLTCGGEIGNAGKYLRLLCAKTGLTYKGCAEIVMPENYIAMFDAPDKAQSQEIVQNANPAIDRIAEMISFGAYLKEPPIGLADRMKSSIVNALFYPIFVHAKKFCVSDLCIGCGKCARVCVMNNITLKDGRPVWQDHCTHCMACICGCPEEAIEYSKVSVGKPRYQCPDAEAISLDR